MAQVLAETVRLHRSCDTGMVTAARHSARSARAVNRRSDSALPSRPACASRAWPLLALLCAWLCCLPPTAAAQVSRCVDRSGNSVFTDRPCEAVNSASRVPRASAPLRRDSAYRGVCARSLPALVRDLSSAIDSGDVNRLGMLYLWAGVSDAEAIRTLNRLQSIVERPLVDIVPLRHTVAVATPQPPAAPSAASADAGGDSTPTSSSPPAAARDPWAWNKGGPDTAVMDSATEPPTSTADTTAPRTSSTRTVVTGLRLEQTAGKRATPASVVLGLRRAYDCWWISLPSG